MALEIIRGKGMFSQDKNIKAGNKFKHVHDKKKFQKEKIGIIRGVDIIHMINIQNHARTCFSEW